MMKPKSKQASQPSSDWDSSKSNLESSKSKESVLMSRLAKGEKPEISKKDMLKLTTKNYELLPEVKKKKEDERKKEELKDRMK